MQRHLRRGLPALAILFTCASNAALAHAVPTSVVTMGDSYIAGEAGRWLGNSANVVTDRDGTDRACVLSLGLCATYDIGRVYVDGTGANGCHRSDVAEVSSARLPVDRRINLACSGAMTSDLLRSSSGGTVARGEQPQADQLVAVASSTRVRMIVVSIGGNDLHFASIVSSCFTGYLRSGPPCSEAKAGEVSDARIAELTARIERVIDEIRAVMRDAGYTKSGYRLVLQTYPVVMPRAADARYVQGDPLRTVDGCPFYDVDMNWANDIVAPRLGGAVKAAAATRGVEVLELLGAFRGHEFCAKTAAANTLLVRPAPSAAEWGRAVSVSTLTVVGLQTQELFHPNAYGHRALGDCVGALYAARRGSYACTGAAGRAPEDMVLKPLRALGALRLPTIRRPRR